MGWTEIRNTFDSLDDFVRDELIGSVSERFEVLDTAIVPVGPLNYNHVVYSAVRDNNDGRVACAVDLVDYRSDSVCWKSLFDDMGPAEDECPERILKLLTRPAKSETAENWIRRCEKNAAKTRLSELGGSFGKIFEREVKRAADARKFFEHDIINGLVMEGLITQDAVGDEGEPIEIRDCRQARLFGWSAGEARNYLPDGTGDLLEYLSDRQVVDAYFALMVKEDPEFLKLDVKRPAPDGDFSEFREAAEKIVAFAREKPHLMDILAQCVEKACPDISVEIGFGETGGQLALFSKLSATPARYEPGRPYTESMTISFGLSPVPDEKGFRRLLAKTLSETFPGPEKPEAAPRPKD